MELSLEKKYMEIEQMRRKIEQVKKRELVWEPFKKSLMMRLSWNSNALEGNTLSLDETIQVIEYDEVRSGHTYAEYRDAKAVYKATADMLDFEHSTDIDLLWIKKANGIILNNGGAYREKDVYVGTLAEAVYYPPEVRKIPQLMSAYEESICSMKAEKTEGIIREVAGLHIKFERIHPFTDGNGRTGRLIMSQQLLNRGLLPAVILNHAKYRQAFRMYHKNGSVEMMQYVVTNGILESMRLMQDAEQNYLEQREKRL